MKDIVDKNKLTRDYLLKFVELYQNDKEQLINININNTDFFSSDITAFKAGILPDDCKDKIKEDDIITLAIKDYELSFYGFDYLWWIKHKSTFTKLFKETSTEKKESKSSKDEQYVVACANLTENGIEEIKSHKGTAKSLVEFINEEIKKRELQSFREALIVFKFNYTEKDNTDPLVWSSIEELAEQGVVILK